MARPKSINETKSVVKSIRFKPSILQILLRYAEVKNIKGLSNTIEHLTLDTNSKTL